MSPRFTRRSKSARNFSFVVALRLVLIALLICAAILAGSGLRLLPTGGQRLRNRFNRRFCRLACWALGIRVVASGAPPLVRPALLISNHVSWTDVVALGSVTPICFLARHDVANWPGLGLLARLFGTLFVERGLVRQIPVVNAAMAQRMLAGDIVSFFPEATTGDGTRQRRFHAVHVAAARDLLRASPEQSSVAVTPTAIVYSRRRGLPTGRAERAALAWYGDTDFAPHLLDLLGTGGVDCRISFLPTFPFLRGSDRKAVTRIAETAIRFEVAQILSGGKR